MRVERKTEDRTRHSSRFRLRYPWAIAPTINTTKPVATAMATFVSIDKFIIFPSIMAATPSPPVLISHFLHRFEFQRAYGCQAQEKEEVSNYERRRKGAAMFDVRGLRFEVMRTNNQRKALLRERKIGGCALSFLGDSRRASAFRNS